MSARPIVWITDFNRVEVANALSRYVYKGRFTASDAQSAWSNFEHDLAQGVWIKVGLPGSVWQAGIDLARQNGPTFGVRTLDSLHVACALELGAKRFWTFDARQAKLAEAAGLETKL
jgi:predicted nucleic acid-binding protein